jgi:hypothetical protein
MACHGEMENGESLTSVCGYPEFIQHGCKFFDDQYIANPTG